MLLSERINDAQGASVFLLQDIMTWLLRVLLANVVIDSFFSGEGAFIYCDGGGLRSSARGLLLSPYIRGGVRMCVSFCSYCISLFCLPLVALRRACSNDSLIVNNFLRSLR
jgi:hypothetical protein